MESPGWLDRYARGEREQVWHELRQLGPTIREHDHVAEAQAVCDEMAVRARKNIETVVDRLSEQGFEFHSNDDGHNPVVPFIGPSEGAGALLTWLEKQFGLVPMTMSSWFRLVGDVWLVGTHPLWSEADAADPLVIELEGLRWPDSSMRDHFAEEFEVWQEARAEDPNVGGFVLPVAPDRLHKANVSGGAPYGFRLPDGCADGLFFGEVAKPFVAYLNETFTYGGFPHPTAGDSQWRIKQSLAQGLLPL